MEIDPEKIDAIAADVVENNSVESYDIQNRKSAVLLAKSSPGFVKKATKIWEVVLSGRVYDTTRREAQLDL